MKRFLTILSTALTALVCLNGIAITPFMFVLTLGIAEPEDLLNAPILLLTMFLWFILTIAVAMTHHNITND